VAFNLEHVIAVDSIAIYHTLRPTGKKNSFLVYRNGTFTPFVTEYQKSASALALEVIACNIGNNGNDTLIDDQTSHIDVFPNPVRSKVRIQSKFDVTEEQIAVFNILGQQINCKVAKISPRIIDVGLTGNKPGIYLLRVRHGSEFILKKIILVQSE
jgi:predicted ATP-grasp superfamily ATP-dependent carboligase